MRLAADGGSGRCGDRPATGEPSGQRNIDVRIGAPRRQLQGSALAVHFARKYPERVDKLILFNVLTREALSAGAPIPVPVAGAFSEMLPAGEFWTPCGATEALPLTLIGAARFSATPPKHRPKATACASGAHSAMPSFASSAPPVNPSNAGTSLKR